MQEYKSNNARLGKQLLNKYLAVPIVAGVTAMSSGCYDKVNHAASSNLPTDVKPTCVANIAPWFKGGSVTPNGAVNPANGLHSKFADFAGNTRCDFYQWGSQMFLWLTSGSVDNPVFSQSPGFYDVSVAVNKQRRFIGNNEPMMLVVRKSKTNDEIELGQAGGGNVLLSQNGSLVYYGLHANDVYAVYTSGIKNKSLTSNEFPNTQDQLNQVIKYGNASGYPLGGDKNALALELKTSWVDVKTVVNPFNYILTKAVVPLFDRKGKDPKTGKQQWSIVGNETKTLAMVGMHIVGTVNSHPEMVWATFEHVSNAPDSTYTYTNTLGKTALKTYNSSGHWSFIKSNVPAPVSITSNAEVSAYTGKNPGCVKVPFTPNESECIVNIKGANIAPIDVLRLDPWGNDHTKSASIANNTDLVSINVSVLSQLKAGDVRKNYIQTGGIWTSKGQIPTSGADPDLRGSLKLANTTMETFYQFHNKSFNPGNCFGCHYSSSSDPTGISHIFSHLQALPAK